MAANASAGNLSSIHPKDRSCELKISPRRKSLDAELYGLGRTLRHLQPPGGNESGVFDAFRLPPVILVPSCKAKDYHHQSRVFSSPKLSPPRPVTPYKETTHYKLFAMPPPQPTPRKHKLTHSTVFDFSSIPVKTRPLIKKCNPLTGKECPITDPPASRRMLVKRNPITFEGIAERHVPSRCKQPPGGHATLSLEYQE